VNDGFVAGLLLGFLIGLAVRPLLFGLVARREWRAARDDAELADAFVEGLAPRPHPISPRGPNGRSRGSSLGSLPEEASR
jgi:hypothetical protein